MKTNLLKQLILTSFLSLMLGFSALAQTGGSKIGQLPIADGPFEPMDESFTQYQYPDWFRDAKLGFWAHWGPQAVPRQGDWYAQRMYSPGKSEWHNKAYDYHVKTYGHPSVFGYKDIIPLWKAERWDADKLMELYKKAGAKYFVSMGTHHDNFFLWDSNIHEWNSVKMGPNKDVVKIWQEAAKKQGMKFGVSEHLGASYTWFQASHGSDKTGPLAGVPYDGADPEYASLYHEKTQPGDSGWLTNNLLLQIEWFNRIKELIDLYSPDLLYSDSQMPFGDIGRSMVAHYYNQNILRNNGKPNAVYTCKEASQGKWVQDVERGVLDTISEYPWQTDTSIGDWYYSTGQKYKSAESIIQMLVDIVSKNGNLLINIVQTPEGDLENDMLHILDSITVWTAANGEGIYGSRPWQTYGEKSPEARAVKPDRFNENYKFNSKDIRFTTKDGFLYAFCLGTPTGDIKIMSLGKNSRYKFDAIKSIKMVGSNIKVKWSQEADAMVIKKPSKLPEWPVIGFRIEFATSNPKSLPESGVN
jgi:alpha-L-fucosidase